MEQQNTIETNSEKIDKILKYQEDGYFFHGSPDSNIEVLEPRKASDTDSENAFNNDEAVFACKTPLVCIFALQKQIDDGVNKKIIPSDSWSFGGRIAKFPKGWKKYLENTNYEGTLYVLPPNSFIHTKGWQAKSKEKVKPTDRIPVSLETFFSLGGKIVWKEDDESDL